MARTSAVSSPWSFCATHRRGGTWYLFSLAVMVCCLFSGTRAQDTTKIPPVKPDTLARPVPILKPGEAQDTTAKPKLTRKRSLTQQDSLRVADSLRARDSLGVRRDTTARGDTSHAVPHVLKPDTLARPVPVLKKPAGVQDTTAKPKLTRKLSRAQRDSLRVADSLRVRDSLGVRRDTTARGDTSHAVPHVLIPDTLARPVPVLKKPAGVQDTTAKPKLTRKLSRAQRDSLRVADSLRARDSLGVRRDTTARSDTGHAVPHALKPDTLARPVPVLKKPAGVQDTTGKPKLTRKLSQTQRDSLRVADSLRARDSLGVRPDTTARSDTSHVVPPVLKPDNLARPVPVLKPGEAQDTTAKLKGKQKRPRAQRDSLRIADSLSALDSLGVRPDTTAPSDSGYVVYLDSTVRVEQFVHRRYDIPAVQAFPKKRYSLYLDTRCPAYKRVLEIDSTGVSVKVRETINDLDVKVPVTITLEDYIKQRYEEEKLNNWRSFIITYDIREKGDELAGLLSSITNISIPVPSNPLMSIFGPPIINIRPTGAVDIRAGFRSETSDQVTISQLDRTRNEPNFNQDVQINISGTIGDKLNIMADWNTQRTFEYENQLKIKYTGYEDEIIQSVEAGNVSLQTPSLVGSGQALFGIKARMQLGPLMLTGLVSQKKGQAKEMSISGGTQQRSQDIPPWQYSTTHYFVDTSYRQFFELLHKELVRELTPGMVGARINEIDVWVSLNGNLNNPSKRQVCAYIDLPPRRRDEQYPLTYDSLMFRSPVPGQQDINYYVRLDKDQYRVDAYSGYISLNTSITDNQSVAISYGIDGPVNPFTGDDRLYYGEFAGSDTSTTKPLILKLIKPANLQPGGTYTEAWALMLKNIYSLGGRDLKKEGFSLDIFYTPKGNPEVKDILENNLLQVLGLDRYRENNTPGSDNIFDFIPGLTVDVDNAEIIFPTLRPFDQGILNYFAQMQPPRVAPDSLLYPDVYDTTVSAAKNDAARNNYTIRVVSSTAASSRFSLGGMNIVEGSVQVLLNGQVLTPNVDYTIDYIIGEVVIKNPQALVPGADVKVKFEQNDLFQIAAKTLMGARGEMNFTPTSKFGFTIMNLNQATISDKVRLGEEPTNNTIIGIDAQQDFELPFLTKALNLLPFYRTKEMSTLVVSGEGAYILPNSNTKQSTILGDNGASVAYIDDFEGSQKTIPFTVSYFSWKPASPPLWSPLGEAMPETTKMWYKAKLSWFNNSSTPAYEPVSITEIWPNKSFRTGENFVTVLIMDYDPSHRGTYNFSPNLDSTLHREKIGGNTGNHDDAILRRKNWNGIMRYVSTTAGNLIEQNITYLQLWVKTTGDVEDLKHGRLYVDLGRISEDVIPNGLLNSEDIIKCPSNPTGLPRGLLDPAQQDRGLDMLWDVDERSAYADFMAENNGDPDIDPADPAGDDFRYATGSFDFSKINGSELNGQVGNVAPDGLFPNTEDLNGNNWADNVNTYLEYELPLDSVYVTDSTAFEQRNEFIVGGVNGWHQIRIPLQDPSRLVPLSSSQSPQAILQNVQYVRVWISGFAKPVRVRIAEFDLVGNQWLSLTESDSIMKVSVVNVEDNSPEYTSPPGVIRQRDRTQPDQVIYGNEQSLSLLVRELPRDSSREAVRYFPGRGMDVFSYRSMKLFIHGDPTFQYLTPANYDAEFYIRFGVDTANYYEYRQPIWPGWDPLNDINIDFSELTSVKAARDSATQLFRVPVRNGTPGSSYGVRGNPSLTQIRYFGVGVKNPRQGSKLLLKGDVWVNELRVIDADNSTGYSYRFDSQLKIADFGSVGFNFRDKDPNFHAIDGKFGDRITARDWAVNTNFSLERFLPEEWQGTQLQVGYSHAESIMKPKYLPSTDILVDEAATRAAERPQQNTTPTQARDKVLTESQSLSVRESYSLPTIHINLPTKVWYVDNTFNKLTYGFTYTTSYDRNPSIAERKQWSWGFRMSYALNFPTTLYVQPLRSLFDRVFLLDDFKDWKLYFFPMTNLSAGLDAQRSRSTEVNRTTIDIVRDTRNFAANKSVGFGWKLTENGLLGLAGDYRLSMSRDLQFLDNDTVGRNFGAILRTMFFGGRDGTYGQQVNVTSRPKLPNILDIPQYFDLSFGYGVNYRWQNSFQHGDIGKSAGVDNRISITSNVKLKAMTDPWFEFEEEAEAPPTPAMRTPTPPVPRPARMAPRLPDSTKGSKTDSLGKGLKTDSLGKGLKTDSLGKGLKTDSLGKGLKPDSLGKGLKTDSLGKGLKTDSLGKGLKTDSLGKGLKPDSLGKGLKPDSLGKGLKPDSLGKGLKTDSLGKGLKPDSLGKGLKPDSLGKGLKPDSLSKGLKPDSLGKGLKPDSLSKGQKTDSLGKGVKTDSLGKSLKTDSLARSLKIDSLAKAPKTDSLGKGLTMDSLGAEVAKEGKGGLKDALQKIRSLGKLFIKIPFLDFETIAISFDQQNHVQNSGVVGTTGFMNFWSRWPGQGSTIEAGPSRLYQLGVINDPSGTLQYSPSSKFPFVGWKTLPGIRAANAQLTDQLSQANNITLRTSRALWPGASIELNWKVGWQYSRNNTITTDSLGNPQIGTTSISGSVERSYFSVPPVLLFKFFKSSLDEVGKKYELLKAAGVPQDAALAQSFETGLEAFPVLSKILGQFVPRANWTIRWSGLEKIGGISSVVQQMSLDHSYQSTFRRDFTISPDGSERTGTERIMYGFSPLAGITSTFKEFLKGNFTGSFRYNTTTSYDLFPGAENIVETLSQEMSLTLNYSRTGFSIPLFGLNLKNDIEMSLTYSSTKNTKRQHDPNYLAANPDGTPLEGNTRTSLEPRLRYVMSSRVTASVYYKYTNTAPDEGGSTVPGISSNEFGVDIHISIQ